MRNPNITQALTVAQQVYHTTADDGSKIDLIADLLIGMYGLSSSHREIILEVIDGQVPAVRAVRAIKAITAMYDTEA
jgi:hypothetical protein